MEDKEKIEGMTVDSISALYTALAAFQGECPTIQKNKKAHYGKYADLTEILATIRPLLSKHGLAVCQFVETRNADTYLRTLVTHKDGHCLESNLKFDYTTKNIQQFGSLITYMRRYSLTAILGIVSDDDVDDRNKIDDKDHTYPKEGLYLNEDQIAEINDMVDEDTWKLLKPALEERGYQHLGQIESSKFEGMKKFIAELKPKKIEAIDAY